MTIQLIEDGNPIEIENVISWECNWHPLQGPAILVQQRAHAGPHLYFPDFGRFTVR